MAGTGTDDRQSDPNTEEKRKKIQNVRTYKGANIDSDHLFVVAKMNMGALKENGGKHKKNEMEY